MIKYEDLFNESDMVICYKKGLYKFLKGFKVCMDILYPTQNDVVRFLKSSYKVMYCDDKQHVIEINFNSKFID